MQWLRDGLRIIDSAAESGEYASRVPDTGGVYMVPAFVGLMLPLGSFLRGTMWVSLGTEREHIVRAALEASAIRRVMCLKP